MCRPQAPTGRQDEPSAGHPRQSRGHRARHRRHHHGHRFTRASRTGHPHLQHQHSDQRRPDGRPTAGPPRRARRPGTTPAPAPTRRPHPDGCDHRGHVKDHDGPSRSRPGHHNGPPTGFAAPTEVAPFLPARGARQHNRNQAVASGVYEEVPGRSEAGASSRPGGGAWTWSPPLWPGMW